MADIAFALQTLSSKMVETAENLWKLFVQYGTSLIQFMCIISLLTVWNAMSGEFFVPNLSLKLITNLLCKSEQLSFLEMAGQFFNKVWNSFVLKKPRMILQFFRESFSDETKSGMQALGNVAVVQDRQQVRSMEEVRLIVNTRLARC